MGFLARPGSLKSTERFSASGDIAFIFGGPMTITPVVLEVVDGKGFLALAIKRCFIVMGTMIVI